MIDSIKDLRHSFFAYRNGMLAETLKSSGNPHKLIFGLNIPQISAIARDCSLQRDEILRMWQECASREERLTALYLLTAYASALSPEECMELADTIKGAEEADILAFRVLKHTPHAKYVAEMLAARQDRLSRYLASAILRHI